MAGGLVLGSINSSKDPALGGQVARKELTSKSFPGSSWHTVL